MSDFTLGEHEAKIDILTAEVTAMRSDVTKILDILAEKRGERRVAVWLAGSAGALLVTILGKVLALVAKGSM